MSKTAAKEDTEQFSAINPTYTIHERTTFTSTSFERNVRLRPKSAAVQVLANQKNGVSDPEYK